jgi:ribosomal protein S27AE
MKTFGAILLTLIAMLMLVALLGEDSVPVIFLIVLGTSVWVLIDAKKIGVKAGPVSGLVSEGPAGWFFSCLLLWIIAFPYYLTVRDQLGQTRKKCPQCLGVVLDGARKCMHCGGDLAVPVVEQTLPVVKQPPRDSTIEEYERWKKSQEL